MCAQRTSGLLFLSKSHHLLSTVCDMGIASSLFRNNYEKMRSLPPVRGDLMYDNTYWRGFHGAISTILF
jgi:hypothetical protein